MELHLWLRAGGVLEVRIDGFLGIEIVRLCRKKGQYGLKIKNKYIAITFK